MRAQSTLLASARSRDPLCVGRRRTKGCSCRPTRGRCRGARPAAAGAAERGRETPRIARKRRSPALAAQTQALDDVVVLRTVHALEIIQQPAPLTHHDQQAAPGVEVLFVRLHVLGQVFDPLGQDRHLNRRRAGVRFRLAELADDPKTASGVAERMGTSVQSVTYHLDRLSDAGVIGPVETWYSKKGKEMTVYGVESEKLVIDLGADEGEIGSDRSA